MSVSGYVRTIELTTPALGNNTADVQRLEQVLKRALNTGYVHIPWHLAGDLSAQLREWHWQVKAVLFKDRRSFKVVALLDPKDPGPVLGAAVDIGTTRMVIALIDLETGMKLGETGFDNPQADIGPDVLTRIHHARTPAGREALQCLAVDTLNQHLARLCKENNQTPDRVFLVAGAGNTAMTHLFAGLPAFGIIQEPYIPCTNIPDTLDAADLGLAVHPGGQVFLFPNIGSYFGGDLLAGILAADLDQKDDPCIMVDVGTNAEIVLGNKDWLMACAGAAGPALESGVSQMGMTAKPGVIDRVRVDPETRDLVIHTIDDEPAVGICGSGMIDLAAALFVSGRIDIRGKLVPEACGDRLIDEDSIAAFELVAAKDSGTGQAICLSQVDLNSLTSAKAAMYTILEVIVSQTAGLSFSDLARFYVAGTFGSFINPKSAITIGMLPDIPLDRFQVLGNTSLKGAKQVLTDPAAFDRVMAIRDTITYIELNVNQGFMNLFSGAKFYPHTDTSRFPSVKV
ncbi:MAG: ASKHA domain-containing protein [Desulfotignum sp.]|nr:ASKHA domain-containing protein [Desulfotignum sp.]MCF8139155.1 ASKHA domain-containing protein [Desulfotignum sp.]